MKISLKYLKKNFKLDNFLKGIEKYNYKKMDQGNMLDRAIYYGLNYDEPDISFVGYDKLNKLAIEYKLLPKITDNFKYVDRRTVGTRNIWVGATLLYSKKNKTYYLFIDHCNKKWIGCCLYYKSKNKKIIWNKMLKFIRDDEYIWTRTFDL